MVSHYFWGKVTKVQKPTAGAGLNRLKGKSGIRQGKMWIYLRKHQAYFKHTVFPSLSDRQTAYTLRCSVL